MSLSLREDHGVACKLCVFIPYNFSFSLSVNLTGSHLQYP